MEKIINLQLLRAIAALMVVFYHAANLFFKIGGEKEGNLFSFFSHIGYAGVDVFFVISGYIIWVSTKEVSDIKGISSYLYNRATRIYLGYWPYCLLFLLFSYLLSIQVFPNVDILGSFLLTENSIPNMLIDVAWTLKFELYFYGCFAVLLVLPKQYLKWAVLALTGLLVLIQLWYVWVVNAYHPDNFYQQSMFFWFYGSPFCFEFLMGCLVAWFFERRRLKWISPCLIGVIGLLYLAISYQDSLVNGALSQGYFVIQRVLLYGVAAVLFLMALIELEKRGVIIFKRAALLFGGASYSMYLAHAVFLYFITRSGLALYFKAENYDPMWTTLSVVLLMLIYSVLHYLYIEKPVMRLSKSFKGILFKRL